MCAVLDEKTTRMVLNLSEYSNSVILYKLQEVHRPFEADPWIPV